ncbi:MAG: D-aminoacylase [Bacillota bacterium]|nr:D-aminoacylase [Bacillota bacterium]
MFDILITGGKVLDGAGNPWRHGDVAIKGDRIAAIGNLAGQGAAAPLVIDAAGLAVTPGFIDMHSHSDMAFLVNPIVEPKIRQGITTEVVGQDGIAAAPMAAEHTARWRRHLSGLNGDPDLPWDWRSMGDYLDALERAGVGHNVASYAPHGNIRLVVMGPDDRPPTGDEMVRLVALTRESLQQGAFALSTGLIYPPCCYADAAELAALAAAVAAEGSFFVSHQRNEGFRVLESMTEMLDAGRAGGCPIHFSHFKAAGKANWHKLPAMFEMLEQARGQGLDVTYDQYPYTAGSTMLSSLLPPAAHAGGTDRLLVRLADPAQREAMRHAMQDPQAGWESMTRNATWDQILVSSVASETNAAVVGKTVAAIAVMRGADPYETVFDLILEEKNAVGMVSFLMSEESVRDVMRHPYQMVCTDGLLGGTPHPRVYGSFPRVLGRYVREEKVLDLAGAVRKMTSFPAQRLGLAKRGLLREGYFADVTVFNPDTVIDRATYAEPRQFPVGIEHVIVNGVPVVSAGRTTGRVAGKVLRKGQDI